MQFLIMILDLNIYRKFYAHKNYPRYKKNLKKFITFYYKAHFSKLTKKGKTCHGPENYIY